MKAVHMKYALLGEKLFSFLAFILIVQLDEDNPPPEVRSQNHEP
jgi:hypothetical protein